MCFEKKYDLQIKYAIKMNEEERLFPIPHIKQKYGSLKLKQNKKEEEVREMNYFPLL